METFSSNHQCGFQKGYNTQYCLLAMVEKWESAVGNGKLFGELLTDLSKGPYIKEVGGRAGGFL